ncbi:MAG: hypothetical protein KGM91_07775 [Burkholderiales bacterium]|nr:hypothetical protein [Burkholderiales bacterium]
MKPDDAPLLSAFDTADEQRAYARLLEVWTRVGALLLLAAFGASIGGLLPPTVAFERLPALWGHTLAHFQALSGTRAGWGGLGRASAGDLANLLGIALLVSGPPLCLLALVPAHARRRDWMQVGLCVALAALMVIAAAGLPRHTA